MGDDEGSSKKVEAEKAVGFAFPDAAISYNTRDAIIYALGIGATDLCFSYELSDNFSVFPTYPVCLAFKGTETDVISFPPPSLLQLPPGVPMVNPAMILHGEQFLELFRPLNTEDKLTAKTTILGLHDRKKGALQESETIMYDEKGEKVVRLVMGSFIRGLTGFKSAGGTMSKDVPIPNRPPTKVVEEKTSPHQALFYRLSGDYNPLHADPEMASAVGFDKPILHGLCSFGFAARAVLSSFAGNDSSQFKAIKARFASPVYPGETLVTEMWQEGHRIVLQTKVKERNVVVLNNAYVDLHPNTKAKLKKKKKKKKKK